MTVDVVMVKSDLGKKRESPLSRINHVNDMPHDLFYCDGLAIFFVSTPYVTAWGCYEFGHIYARLSISLKGSTVGMPIMHMAGTTAPPMQYGGYAG